MTGAIPHTGTKPEQIFALTSLSPAASRAGVQEACLQSWRAAGLQIRSFNHPSEVSRLTSLYPVEFVPVTQTSIGAFGRHYIPINTMLDWASAHNTPALIINSDIELSLKPWELKRVRWVASGGLCYFIRHNYDGARMHATRELHGIDAFLLHGRDAALFPQTCLSMGQPFWDYWVPYTFALQNRSISSLEFPAAFHRSHSLQWSWKDWHRCALEFDRVTGALGGDLSIEACTAMAQRARERFDRNRTVISPQPMDIQQWVQKTFNCPGRKNFLELGAHTGSDTVWMARLPDVTLHAFEPDPRNHPPPLNNVRLHRMAIADRDGRAPFILSRHGWGQEWTHSSSIKTPKNHLKRYPVTFGESIEVATVKLDTFCQQHDLDVIDFVWADIQGAEREMILGGSQTLLRTRYLYTEYSDDELYENQATLAEILSLLPDFRVIELWEDDVLLENRRFFA